MRRRAVISSLPKTEEVVSGAEKSFQAFRKLSLHRGAQLFGDLAKTSRMIARDHKSVTR